MLLALGNRFARQATNAAAPSTTPGTSVTPGASGAEGSWTEVLSDTVITFDVYGLLVRVQSGASNAQSKQHLLDIGADPAGGTSYAAIVSDLPCGGSIGVLGGPGKLFWLPVYLPAGSAIAVRVQGSNATAGTVNVSVTAFGGPTRPELARAGRYSETIGLGTGSRGTLVTPGVSGADGSWVSLGTTTRSLWWWQVGVQVDDSTSNGQVLHLDLAYGDATNKHMIFEHLWWMLQGTAENEQTDGMQMVLGYCEVPAGAEVFARLSTTLATADSNYNVAAIGIGG